VHRSVGFESGESRLEPVREHRSARLQHVLVNSISAGGGIVCAVLSKEAA